jgi:hypothetical protein
MTLTGDGEDNISRASKPPTRPGLSGRRFFAAAQHKNGLKIIYFQKTERRFYTGQSAH